MRVLYVNHTATLGGGERSLLDLMAALPGGVTPLLACPDGDLANAARELGVEVSTIPAVELSFRLAPAQTVRGLGALCRASVAVRGHARRLQVDLVHANSTRAGLIAAPLRRLGGPPVVVHVRDCLPEGGAAGLTRRTIRSGAALVLANSNYTADRFAPNGNRVAVRTLYNAVDTDAFDPARFNRTAARARLGIDDETPTLGVVAQLTPWKAQDDAIRALAALRSNGTDARLLLVGEAKFARGSETFDNLAYERSLHELSSELGLGQAVRFLGERREVPQILSALDVVLVPSWEEPFGRTVIEAMSMEKPVIATSVGGPAEIVTDGVDGLLRPPREPRRWSDAAAELLAHPEPMRELGRAARRTIVERFGTRAHVEAVLRAYEDVLAGSAG
jgi:L-malate glycosyltransferase